jgi:hypothetical protein
MGLLIDAKPLENSYGGGSDAACGLQFSGRREGNCDRVRIPTKEGRSPGV